MERNNIQALVRKYYENNHEELKITVRIMSALYNVISTAENIDQVSASEQERQIKEFLERPGILTFIRERQPLISMVESDVVEEVKTYFADKLPAYEPLSIYRKSNHPDDNYLYSVLAAGKNGTYACWTSWNESTHSLNHGHTDLATKDDAMSILKENLHDITDEVGKYGIEQSKTIIQEENKEHILNSDLKKNTALQHTHMHR